MTKGGTRAIAHLRRAGVDFTVHEFELGESTLSYGEAVAARLGIPPERLFKTLVVLVDDRPIVGIVPVSGSLSMKRLAEATGGKRAAMAETDEAQRLTGYVVGGISPISQRRRLPMVVDTSVGDYATVYVSAGRRGLQLEMTPDDQIAATGAIVSSIAG